MFLSLTGGQTSAASLNSSAPIKGLTISPVINQITLGPGLLTARTYLEITNTNNYVFSAGLKAVDFKALENNAGVTLSQLGTPLAQYGLANYMSLPVSSISLSPGQSTQVEVDIDNRSDLTAGGHYGAVVISTASAPDSTGVDTVGLNQTLAPLYFVTKTGGNNFDIALSNVRISTYHKGIPNDLALTFKSTGNSFIIPRGYVQISDRKGRVVEKGIINESSNLIIQGTSQTLNTPLQNLNPITLNGKYKINVFYRYEGAQNYSLKTIYFSRGFYINPVIIYIASALVICLLLLYVLQRWWSKR